MSDRKSRWKPKAAPQARPLDVFIGALSKQALSKRVAPSNEFPGHERRSGSRRRAGGLLRQSEDAFRQLFDMSPNALILFCQADSTVRMINVAAARLFGVRMPDASGWHAFDFFSGKDGRPSALAGLEGGGKGAGAEVRLENAAGEAFWALVGGRKLEFHGDLCVLTSVIDITANRKLPRPPVHCHLFSVRLIF